MDLRNPKTSMVDTNGEANETSSVGHRTLQYVENVTIISDPVSYNGISLLRLFFDLNIFPRKISIMSIKQVREVVEYL